MVKPRAALRVDAGRVEAARDEGLEDGLGGGAARLGRGGEAHERGGAVGKGPERRGARAAEAGHHRGKVELGRGEAERVRDEESAAREQALDERAARQRPPELAVCIDPQHAPDAAAAAAGDAARRDSQRFPSGPRFRCVRPEAWHVEVWRQSGREGAKCDVPPCRYVRPRRLVETEVPNLGMLVCTSEIRSVCGQGRGGGGA